MRMYSIEFDNQTATNANGDHDLFELAPADDKPIYIAGLAIAQSTEIGDAQEEQLRWRVIRGHATTGNGTATTPRPMDTNDTAAGAVCETFATSIASAGTAINLHSGAFNLRVGLDYWWPPEARPRCSQADTLIVVRLMSTVTDDVNISGTLYFLEV